MTTSTVAMDASPVLVVDDTPTCLYLVSSLLENLGCRCVCASNAEAALQLAALHRPGWAFIDLFMPSGGGAALSAELHRLYPGMVTYAVSAASARERADADYAAGRFTDLISKPVSRAALARALGLQTADTSAQNQLLHRLETLPVHQRGLFLQLIAKDLLVAQRLLAGANTRTEQHQALHRLAGILAAAAAVDEEQQLREIVDRLRGGIALEDDIRRQIARLMREVSARVQLLAARFSD